MYAYFNIINWKSKFAEFWFKENLIWQKLKKYKYLYLG
jgi:hypothetical protein